MPNSANLTNGNGITFTVNTQTNVVTISINRDDLDGLLDGLLNDDNSSIAEAINNLSAQITALQTDIRNLKTWQATVTEEWVKNLIDTYAVNTSSGLVDYGTADPSTGANNRAQIYIKY